MTLVAYGIFAGAARDYGYHYTISSFLWDSAYVALGHQTIFNGGYAKIGLLASSFVVFGLTILNG